MNDKTSETLCLACAICCNGVLFKDVELQAGEFPDRYRALGLPFKLSRKKECCPQPCAALEGAMCRIYADRPQRCREFVCALLNQVQQGRMELPKAMKIVGMAHKRAAKVLRLMRELGDDRETVSLSVRFRRLSRNIQMHEVDEETAETYSQLTLAVHDLNVLLQQAFYP
jgi:hypothetical protein